MTQEQWELVQKIDAKCGGRVLEDIPSARESIPPDMLFKSDEDVITFRLLREVDWVHPVAMERLDDWTLWDALALAARVLLDGTT